MQIALIDCDNFFVSCERIYRPNLNKRPVVVLSRNDACVVARSNEAKALGIKMGQPFFEIREMCQKYKVEKFAAKFCLYSTISQRVMKIIEKFLPCHEVYSIDEAFALIPPDQNAYEVCTCLKETILMWTGIPVSIGIGPTKTLAKIATDKAKKCGVSTYEDSFLVDYKVEDIWGIGYQSAKKLKAEGIFFARDILNVSPYWIRKNMTIVGERILRELQGHVCLPIDNTKKDQRSMQYTRVFKEKISDFATLENIVCKYTLSLCNQLKAEKLYTNALSLFLENDKGFESIKIALPFYSHDISLFLQHVRMNLVKIYTKHVRYRRAGIMALELTKTESKPLFQDHVSEKITKVIQMIETKFGKDVVKPLSCL